MASIVLEGVSRVYAGGVRAVDGIDLEVKDREFFVLVGPSGCGKTTTLRLIAGFESATAGMIRIGGTVVNGLPPRKRDLAMVVQESALYPHLSVRGNLAFSAQLRGDRWWQRLVDRSAAGGAARRRRRQAERIEAVAQLLEIDPLLTRRPAELSGGQRQRVALGRALVREPAAFLLDEPLSSLDSPLRLELRRELKWLHRQSAQTILYVTHDQVEALMLGERIGVMDRGVIQQVGTPSEIYDQPRNRFVAEFIGSPPMSVFSGRLEQEDSQNGESWSFVGNGWRIGIGQCLPPAARALDGDEVLCGVRPEDVRISETGNQDGGSAAPVGRARARVEEVESRGDCLVVFLTGEAGQQSVVNAMADRSGRRENGIKRHRLSLAARLPATTRLAIGQNVGIEVNVRRLYWFDPRTGENITGGSRASSNAMQQGVDPNNSDLSAAGYWP